MDAAVHTIVTVRTDALRRTPFGPDVSTMLAVDRAVFVLLEPFMPLLSLDALRDRVTALYTAEARLRDKERQILDVRHNRHPIAVPPGMVERAQIVKSGILGSKLEVAKAVLMDDRGPQVTVSQTGVTQKAETERALVQEWLQANITYLARLDNTEPNLNEDQLVRSRGWIKVLPMPERWQNAPRLDLASITSLDVAEIERRVARVEVDKDAYKVQHPPFYFGWAPAENVLHHKDRHGRLLEVVELTEMPVAEVLDTFLDEEGEPLAAKLAEQFRGQTPTPEHTVSVITRADRTHWQVAVMGVLLDNPDGSRADAMTQNGEDEILWEGEHGMAPFVPYARFRGRESTATEPVYQYKGLLDDAVDLAIAYDYGLTQLASSARFAAWPGAFIKKIGDYNPGAIGAGDTPAAFRWAEGGVSDALRVGEDLVVPNMVSPQAYQLLAQHLDRLKSEISARTISDIVSGMGPDASSGYEYAQRAADAETVLEPWIRGAQNGWAEVCRLLLRAASALMRDGSEPIPARHVDEDGMRFVTLTAELADREWDIRVQVRTRPVGGEAAELQTQERKYAMGLTTLVDIAERLGERNPLRMLEKRRQEDLVGRFMASKKIDDILEQRFMAALSDAVAPSMPKQPVVPEALAGLLRSAPVLGRMPLGVGQEAMGVGAQGGVPGVAPPDMAPPPPTVSNDAASQRLLKGPGGQIAGQSQALPGGLERQSEILRQQGF